MRKVFKDQLSTRNGRRVVTVEASRVLWELEVFIVVVVIPDPSYTVLKRFAKRKIYYAIQVMDVEFVVLPTIDIVVHGVQVNRNCSIILMSKNGSARDSIKIPMEIQVDFHWRLK